MTLATLAALLLAHTAPAPPAGHLTEAGLDRSLPGKPLLESSFDDGPGDWYPMPASPRLKQVATHDEEVGCDAPGALRLSNWVATDTNLYMWGRSVPVDDPGRLRLSAQIRGDGLEQGAQAQLMAQLWPEKGTATSYPRTLMLSEDAPWTQTDVVFDVPEQTARIQLLFFLKGKGSVWLDDVVLESTKDEITHFARPVGEANDPALEALARGAASEIPWVFDGDAAREQARKSGRPVLLYVRCTDDDAALDELRRGLDAPALSLREDGFGKDVLFRAGPLSTPRISSFIQEHFVPAIATYRLAGSRRTAGAPPGWLAIGGALGDELFTAEDEDGGMHLGIDTPDGERLRMWDQRVAWDGSVQTLRLSVRMRAEDLARSGEVDVMMQCWKGKKALRYPRVEALREDSDWVTRETTFEVPAGVDSLRLLAYVKGPGRGFFDDFSLTPVEGGDELFVNGAVDEAAGSAGGLLGFPVQSADVTTPALCVIGADGSLVATLDRQGALSDELVARWLERALDTSDPRDVRRTVDAPERALRTAHDLMGEAEWKRAARNLASNAERAGDAGAFYRGLCLHRLGRHTDARRAWNSIAGDTAWGRKAAACLLDAGPRLHEAMTVRAWPKGGGLEATTEDTDRPFRLTDSIEALLEFQRSDGSFGSQYGSEGTGWNDAAITAIAVDALGLVRPREKRSVQRRIDTSVERATAWLVAYAAEKGRPRVRTSAFNNPYVLHTLLARGEKAAARSMVEHIAETQEEDGNWTVYGPHRPASFNTAQNTMALMAARAAELELPEGVLERGLDALEAMRAASGLFPYSSGEGHDWMTTDHGSIGRDPLCEHALLMGGRGSRETLAAALRRFVIHGEELRAPTKRLYDYFDSRAHGGYFFFFAHRGALEAARAFGDEEAVAKVTTFVRAEVLSAQEGDGTFMDKFHLGRAYGTAQALLMLAAPASAGAPETKKTTR